MRKSLVISALLAGALTAASSVTSAQTGGFINLGTIGEAQVYVGSGSNAYRVGNGVLTFVHQISSNSSVSVQVLASCEASWISDSIRFSISELKTPAELEKKAREDSLEINLASTNFSDWQNSELPFIGALKVQVKALCRSASGEPKNVLIPVVSYPESGAQPGGSIAVLTGTVIRREGVLDAWMRTSHFKQQPVMLDGKPWTIRDVVQKTSKPVGTYELRRTAFNCKTKQLAVYHFLDYNKDGGVIDQSKVARETVRFTDIVPNSVGETQLDSVCLIYGGN